MPRLYREAMHRFTTWHKGEELTLRVWSYRRADGSFEAYEGRRMQLEDVLDSWEKTNESPQKLLERLAKVKGVNAAEVVDSEGNGNLIYVDWP